MSTSREEIFSKVQEIVVNSLSVEEEEVTESAALSRDLGAESIDYLDIAFNLEQTFNVKVPQEEFVPREMFSNPDYVEDGKLNAKGLAALKESMPHADLTTFEADPRVDKFQDVFTVGLIVNFVEHKLAARASS